MYGHTELQTDLRVIIINIYTTFISVSDGDQPKVANCAGLTTVSVEANLPICCVITYYVTVIIIMVD